jgi:hypothetical protein
MMSQTGHKAAPEQPEHGFDEGVGRRPRPIPQRRIGGFADGLERPQPATDRDRRRFSEGVELAPDSPANNTEGSFGTGLETPDEPADTHP